MTKNYSVTAIKRDFRAALNQVVAGETVTITRFDEVFELRLVSSADKVPKASKASKIPETSSVTPLPTPKPDGGLHMGTMRPEDAGL